MGKPKGRGRPVDMSAPPEARRRKRQPTTAAPYGGVSGHNDRPEVGSSPMDPHDWYAESRCARCHRETPRKVLTKHVSLEDKAYCPRCWDRLPRHLRTLSTARKTRPKAPPTPDPRAADAESRAVLADLPGLTIAEKMDAAERGLSRKAQARKRYKQNRKARRAEAREATAWRCDECGHVGTLAEVTAHQQTTVHLFRSRTRSFEREVS